MPLATFTSNDVKASFGAIALSTGRAEGEFLTVEPMSPGFKTKSGAGGDVVRVRSNDRRAKITVKLFQTSPLNATLSAIYEIDMTLPNGAGVAAFLIEDLNGTTLLGAAESWIVQPPKVTFSDDVEMREWEFEAADLRGVYGGN